MSIFFILFILELKKLNKFNENLFNFVKVTMASAMSTTINPDRHRWVRLVFFLDDYCKEELKYIFHINIQAPKNGTKDLYNFLLKYGSLLKSYIYVKEYDELFPQSGITYEEDLDISLLGRVILVILRFYHENKNNQFSQQQLKLIGKDINFIEWLLEQRNWLYHKGNKHLSEAQFEKRWDKILHRLLSQCCRVDLVSINYLKSGDIFSNEKYQSRAEFLLNEVRVVFLNYFSVENN